MGITDFFKDLLKTKPKPIISLTTIPTRLISDYHYDIKFCLESLLNQNYDDYEVHMNIPYVFKRTNEEYVIPEWLTELTQQNPKLKIHRTEDYGTLTKLLPTVLRATDPETVIIVVDDDLIYNTEMIAEHMKNQTKWPNNPVGYDGMRSRNEDGSFSSHFNDTRDYYYSGTYRDSRVDILQHYKSISYKKRFFGEDFLGFIDQYYTWHDDLVIAAYFSSKKVDRMVTFYPLDKNCETFEDWQNNVGRSFPIMGSTQHLTDEGCNINRTNREDDNSSEIYKFIDSGYLK
jgi:glycosyltransferase involved in cell wall biosynthesis